MRTRLTVVASLIASCAAVSAQVINVNLEHRAPDVWGSYFSSGHKITFSGEVTGIERAPATSGGESYVAILVKNDDGGGTAIVELGPAFFIDQQVAQVNEHDRVQVTGSKVMENHHGVIVASMVRVNGQGGPVLALRRPSGAAYWPTPAVEVATQKPTLPDTETDTTPQQNPDDLNFIPPQSMYQLNGGFLNVDTGPQWYWGNQDYNYNVGGFMNVVTGPYPFTINNSNLFRGRQLF